MKKNLILFLSIVVLFSGCTKNKKDIVKLPEVAKEAPKTDPVVKPQTDIAKPQNDPVVTPQNNIVAPIELPRLPAVIKAENQSALSFQTSGILVKIDSQAGDTVKKGQVLASLDTTNMQFELQNAKIDLEIKQLAFAQAQKKYDRYLAQFKAGIWSEGALEAEKNNFELTRLSYESSKTNLKSKEYAFKLMQMAAPFEGVVTKLYQSIGNFITPGMPVFELVQNESVLVYAHVPENYYDRIKVGMTFAFSDPRLQNRGNLTVQKVVPIIDSETRTFDVYGKIIESVHRFVPGEYVEIILK